MKKIEPKTIDLSDYSLDDWLKTIFTPPPGKVFINCTFPSDKIKNEYINNIHERTEEEVKNLLSKFLMSSGSLVADKHAFDYWIWARDNRPDIFDKLSKTFFYKRLVNYFILKGKSSYYPWEGITWILDLLPGWPNKALRALDSYIMAHAQLFTDQRLEGHYDAEQVIRAKFIGLPKNTSEQVAFLHTLLPREFESLIQKLYDAKKYKTKLTKQTRDGGKDIIAKRSSASKKEILLVECKNYNSKVGVEKLHNLLGVVSSAKANKGVLITSSTFTAPAISFFKANPRIELINGKQLILLLNEFLGTDWPLRIDSLIRIKPKS